MTNFDVIEAYIQDFTVWKKYDGKVIVSNNKAIVKANTPFSGNWIISNNKKFEIGKIKVTGLDGNIGNNFLSYSYYNKDGNRIIIRIKKDGIYEFPNNEYDAEAGFHCNSSLTFSNDIIIEQLPTSILKDFSGNGNHAYLYGGKGKLNSGMGVYKFDFLSDLRINSAYIPYCDRQEDKICSLIEHPAGWLFQFVSLSDIPAFKVEVKGIVNDRFIYRYYDENRNRGKEIIINKDGIYELPISYSVENNTGVGIVCSDACVDNVCFTQIPDYPDQLCYDGKMYAIAYGMPILTDYTIIADRTWFKDKINSWSYFADKKKAFTFERTSNGKSFNAMSFAAETAIELQKDGVSYQTKASYNGNAINYHSDQADNDDRLVIGSTKDSLGNQCFIGCHSDILIFNRTLTEYEISWVKNNMMCSKQQEPDIDL